MEKQDQMWRAGDSGAFSTRRRTAQDDVGCAVLSYPPTMQQTPSTCNPSNNLMRIRPVNKPCTVCIQDPSLGSSYQELVCEHRNLDVFD